MKAAQHLLIRIGGQAELVAGWMGHYYADASTPKKPSRQRVGQIGAGRFGKNLMASNDAKRGDLAKRQLIHAQYLAHKEQRSALRALAKAAQVLV